MPLDSIPQPCSVHPDRLASVGCDRCARPFCPDCRVTLAGQSLCAGCKIRALRDLRRRSGRQDRDAEEALVYSLMAMVPVLSPVAGPLALIKGFGVLAAKGRDPARCGRSKARAAVAITAGVFLLWVVGAVLWLLRR